MDKPERFVQTLFISCNVYCYSCHKKKVDLSYPFFYDNVKYKFIKNKEYCYLCRICKEEVERII